MAKPVKLPTKPDATKEEREKAVEKLLKTGEIVLPDDRDGNLTKALIDAAQDGNIIRMFCSSSHRRVKNRVERERRGVCVKILLV